MSQQSGYISFEEDVLDNGVRLICIFTEGVHEAVSIVSLTMVISEGLFSHLSVQVIHCRFMGNEST